MESFYCYFFSPPSFPNSTGAYGEGFGRKPEQLPYTSIVRHALLPFGLPESPGIAVTVVRSAVVASGILSMLPRFRNGMPQSAEFSTLNLYGLDLVLSDQVSGVRCRKPIDGGFISFNKRQRYNNNNTSSLWVLDDYVPADFSAKRRSLTPRNQDSLALRFGIDKSTRPISALFHFPCGGNEERALLSHYFFGELLMTNILIGCSCFQCCCCCCCFF